jgi:hypothetical protein
MEILEYAMAERVWNENIVQAGEIHLGRSNYIIFTDELERKIEQYRRIR